MAYKDWPFQDSVRAGLQKPRPWHKLARIMKRDRYPHEAIAKACGVARSSVDMFFNPAMVRKVRARQKADRDEIRRDPVAFKHYRAEQKRMRAERLARPGGVEDERARHRRLKLASDKRIHANPKRRAQRLDDQRRYARVRRMIERMLADARGRARERAVVVRAPDCPGDLRRDGPLAPAHRGDDGMGRQATGL